MSDVILLPTFWLQTVCDCSDNNQLHFGAIVCMLGTRYKSYCSNIVRTLLVEPTSNMQTNYDLLLRVEEEMLNKLQHGTLTQNVVVAIIISPHRRTTLMRPIVIGGVA